MSYNFESNYGASTSAPDFTNAYLDKFMLPYDKPDPDLDDYRRRPLGGVRRSIHSNRQHQQQITRKNIYRVIETYLTKACLLRTICEVATTPLAKYDGILGDILHILLTPSTSIHEIGIGNEYYLAEEIGRQSKSCSEFIESCPKNGLDLFTKYF
ncbi:uncharacterized protein LOC134836313 [Culicoides brevitarsis]|uniref:uncharacterized protein LOC134836313 n=1 Tax=Culicoides brevitarsis TaxID=469753 RepID=UPI00307C8CEF